MRTKNADSKSRAQHWHWTKDIFDLRSCGPGAAGLAGLAWEMSWKMRAAAAGNLAEEPGTRARSYYWQLASKGPAANTDSSQFVVI